MKPVGLGHTRILTNYAQKSPQTLVCGVRNEVITRGFRASVVLIPRNL